MRFYFVVAAEDVDVENPTKKLHLETHVGVQRDDNLDLPFPPVVVRVTDAAISTFDAGDAQKLKQLLLKAFNHAVSVRCP
jgi:hypothetical protein